jgi:hypothetical protein
MKITKEVLEKLESEGWQFKPSFAMPDIQFKSPRMKYFDVLLHNNPTEQGFRNEEIECLITEVDKKLSLCFDAVKKDLINQTKLILGRNQVPPQEFSVSFDVDMTK